MNETVRVAVDCALAHLLQGKHVIEGRPGASMAPLDMDGLEYRLK
jgi:hypothetical protein